jgi:hypothetical protein
MIAAWRVEFAHRTTDPEPDHNTVVHNTVGGQVHIDTAAREGHDVLTVSNDGPTGHPLIPSASQIQRRQKGPGGLDCSGLACRLSPADLESLDGEVRVHYVRGSLHVLKSGSTFVGR